MTDEERLRHAIDLVAPHLDEPAATWLGGWIDPPVLPPLPAGHAVRLVYALPATRVAGLAPWRDAAERWGETPDGVPLHVLAMEASTWARLVLRGHLPTHATLARTPVECVPGALQRLRGRIDPDALRAAHAEWGEDAAWIDVASGLARSADPGHDRRAALDEWLASVRPIR